MTECVGSIANWSAAYLTTWTDPDGDHSLRKEQHRQVCLRRESKNREKCYWLQTCTYLQKNLIYVTLGRAAPDLSEESQRLITTNMTGVLTEDPRLRIFWAMLNGQFKQGEAHV